MVPLRNIAMQMETFSEVVDIIKSKVDDTGSFKDTASPELRRARERLLGKETQLKELLSRMPGVQFRFEGTCVWQFQRVHQKCTRFGHAEWINPH